MGVWIDRIGKSLYVSVSRDGKPRKRRKVAEDTPEGWELAHQVVAEVKAQRARDAVMGLDGHPPKLSDMADRYLREDTAHLAPSTRGDRPSYLRPDGPLLGPLGSLRLDAITPAVLRGWWGEHVEAAGRSVQTGRHYLTVLHGVYQYAIDLGLVETSPVTATRDMVRRHDRTKRGRASSDPAQRIRPVEHSEELERLLVAAREDSLQSLAFVLLALDAGLRLGEALGIRWGCVVWGSDETDATRRLELDSRSNRPRGVGSGTAPKSGRTRSVALSRRLRRTLLELRLARGRPGAERLVLQGIDASNWRKRNWRRICERAKIGDRDIKDLRDTYASWLLSLGIPGAYVSQQLGHASWSVTADHYAKWIPKGYEEPPRLGPGEVPADLLARLATPESENVSDASAMRQ